MTAPQTTPSAEPEEDAPCENCHGEGRAPRHDVSGMQLFMDTCMMCRGSGKEKDNLWK